METNKYYCPDISEYHIGFEYEFEDINCGGSTMEWVKSVIKDGTQIDDITRTHKGEEIYNIRVKLLDQEDIESCGILYRGKANSIIDVDVFVLLTPEKRFTLKINSPISKVEITVEDAIYEPNNKNTLFLGIIKNLSELKKLIVQLNIK